LNLSVRRLSGFARINEASLFFWYPCALLIEGDKGRIKIMTAVAVEGTIGYPHLDSEFSDALETVLCYKDFSAGIVRQSGAIEGYDRIRAG
jgi:hypothetical protein